MVTPEESIFITFSPQTLDLDLFAERVERARFSPSLALAAAGVALGALRPTRWLWLTANFPKVAKGRPRPLASGQKLTVLTDRVSHPEADLRNACRGWLSALRSL